MTNEYSVDEMLRFYEETVKENAKNEPSRKKAARLAKWALETKYPGNIYSLGASMAITGKFWHKAKVILNKYYPVVVTPKLPKEQQYRFEAPEADHEITLNSKKKPFSRIMRELAATGFIPNLAVFNVFMNGETPSASSFTAAVSNLKKSNYLCEKNAFGYEAILVTPKETPEQKAAREAEEARQAEKAEIKRQIEMLADRLSKLS